MMAFMPFQALFGLFLLFRFNEAAQFKLQMHLPVVSKEEIMRNMTAEKAARMVLGMTHTKNRPELVALIQERLGHKQQRQALRHRSKAHMHHKEDPKGYAALDNAKNMLNEMLEESHMKLELEEVKCAESDHKMRVTMEETEQDIATFNSKSAEARGHMLDAQGAIMLANDKIPSLQGELAEVERTCAHDVGALKSSLRIVAADIEVMVKILDMTKCQAQTLLLVQCNECQQGDGKGTMMIQEDHLQPLVGKLRSSIAREYMQANLAQTYHEAVTNSPAIALTQEAVHHVRRLVLAARDEAHDADGDDQGPGQSTNVSDVPKPPEPFDCIPTTRCTIGESPNCERLRDRFLVIQTGISDKKDELQKELVEKENYCQTTFTSYNDQINQMQDKLREEQTNLAMATQEQVDAESQSRVKAEQHSKLVVEYQETMKECCDNQNEFKSEACALEKIRGELFKMEGQSVFITDCEVSDWKPYECSVTCGGGTQRLERSIMVHPAGGAKCPPLTMERACNQDPCPVDCVLNDWSEFSACSAECGGGIRMRARSVKIEPLHGGEPCGETEEEEPCNIQSCDADCELQDWTGWSRCSKMCGGGTQRRTKAIGMPARGTGTCFQADDTHRLEFKTCNEYPCTSLLPSNRTTLNCNSKVDVVLLVDGSGSLGQLGWDLSKKVANNLVNALMSGSSGSANVAVQLFSGPTTWSAYERCTSNSAGAKVDMVKDCGISWPSHFTTVKKTALDAVAGMKWPAATTLTSVALAEAMNELQYGRENTNAVVVCITDGKPMSDDQTKVAALRLQEKARVIWVPVGASAPIDLIRQMATKPEDDHVVQVRQFQDLDKPKVVNAVLANTCPLVE